jgi:hypothetical protein
MRAIEEVRGLEVGREGESITEEDAEEVAFRGDVIRRDHEKRGWEGWGRGGPASNVLTADPVEV